MSQSEFKGLSVSRRFALGALLASPTTPGLLLGNQVQPPSEVDKEEARRIAVVRKVSPSVVAVVTGGGSGVVVSPDGYALTNFHVVQGQGGALRCGLPDGILYDAVLIGLDKIGDVALIKLLPRKDKDGKDIPFPYAEIGDSDTVRVGDWSLAMGNPFLLAADFTPTVTFGLVSGTHRYQYPERGMFEYTDCIQVDTSINPGNSGGPLFDMQGKLVGINGRGSFDKRGRVNSGVGYAITLNQIQNFLGSLHSGLLVDHASLGATVATSNDEEAERAQVVVSNLITSDAERRGLALGDEVIKLAGRRVATVNQFKNVLGLYPKGWRVPVTYRRRLESGSPQTRQILVRLMGYERKQLDENGRPLPGGAPKPGAPGKPGRPKPPMPPGHEGEEKEEGPPSPALKLYEEKEGYANFLVNKKKRDEALASMTAGLGDPGTAAGVWTVKGKGFLGEKKIEAPVSFAWSELSPGKPEVVSARVDGVDFSLEPLKPDLTAQALRDPAGSGGMLAALHLTRLFLAKGQKAFPQGMTHAGVRPLYPPLDQDPEDWWPLRKMAQVLEGSLGGTKVLAFLTEEGSGGKQVVRPSCLEVWLDPEEDPCEVYLDRFKTLGNGKTMPHQITVRHNGMNFLRLEVDSWELR